MIPIDEQWLFKNPEALASVLRGMQRAKEGKLIKRESLAKYADDEID